MTQPPTPDDTPSGEPPAAGPPPPPPPPPPPGAYPPPGGYPSTAPPPGYASSEDKTWVLVAHFGGALAMFISAGTGGWVPPLIAYLAQGPKSAQVKSHAAAALNFQLVLSIIGAIGWATVCVVVGFIIWPIAMIIGIIFGIIAGMRANDGQFYQYPFNINIVK
jgi:uncharacterized Tic20 family protein